VAAFWSVTSISVIGLQSRCYVRGLAVDLLIPVLGLVQHRL